MLSRRKIVRYDRLNNPWKTDTDNLDFLQYISWEKKRRVKLRNDTPLTAVLGEVAKAVEKSLFWPDFPVRKHSTIFQKNGLL